MSEKNAGRKVGQAKPDLSDESTAELLKKTKSLLRTDFGGKDPLSVIHEKMAAEGVQAGPKSCQAIRKLMEGVAKGDRDRTERRLNEAIRRCETGDDSVEKMP